MIHFGIIDLRPSGIGQRTRFMRQPSAKYFACEYFAAVVAEYFFLHVVRMLCTDVHAYFSAGGKRLSDIFGDDTVDRRGQRRVYGTDYTVYDIRPPREIQKPKSLLELDRIECVYRQ